MNSTNKPNFNEKIKVRGKIYLIAFAKFQEEYNISGNDMIDIINYNDEKEIFQKFENNIESYKYFNIIFFKYDNKEDAFGFLKTFIETNNKNYIIKNNSDYPFFVFFKNKNFNKELLYSYYLENSKELNIKPIYDVKSHNIIFINKSVESIQNLLVTDIANYFYEYDFKQNNDNFYNIEILFMGPTGCGKSTFINYLLGKLRAYSSSSSSFKSKGGVYTHSKYPITITDSEGFEISDEKQQENIFKKLENNVEEELNNRTHIAFYLVPGPFDISRGFDDSIIGPLLKLEQYHIHYYVVMTKDPDESDGFQVTSKRFLNKLINSGDFSRIKHNFENDKLNNIN